MLRASLISLGLASSALLLAGVGVADKDKTGIDRSPRAATPIWQSPEDAFFVPVPPECSEDRIAQSPVVMYSSAGGTLVGLEFDQITVYASGLVLIAGAQSFSGEVSARMAQVPPLEVARLARDLVRLGAAQLCDQSYDVSDVPLKTLSLASAVGSDVRMHTFSYWLPTDQHGMIESAFEQWLLDNKVVNSTLE